MCFCYTYGIIMYLHYFMNLVDENNSEYKGNPYV